MFWLMIYCVLINQLSVVDADSSGDYSGIHAVKELLERAFSERKHSDENTNSRLESIETRLKDIQEHIDNERQWQQNFEEFKKDTLDTLEAIKGEKGCEQLPKLPGKPRRVKLSAVNLSTVIVQWQPSRVKGSVYIRGYYVYYSQVDEELKSFEGIEKRRDTIYGNVTQVEILDLLPDTRYNVSVAAYTNAGIGYRSRPKTVKTLLAGPNEPELRVRLILEDLPKALLSWSKPESPDGDVLGYTLFWGRPGQRHRSEFFDGNTISWTSPNLDSDAMYEFRLFARNEAGYGPSAISDLRTPGIAAPRITLAPKNMKVVANNIVSFFCKALGLPTLEFFWEREGRPLRSDNRRIHVLSMANGTVLRIEPTKARDNTFFTCVAKDNHGESRANATLKVYENEADEIQGYPMIVENPQLKVVEKDHNVTLACAARSENAASPLTIYWLKSNLPLNVKDPRIHVNNTGSLSIYGSRVTDHDKYECVAENDVGVAYSDASMLYVKVRRVPPHFTRMLDDIETHFNGTVAVECEAEGSPKPVVYWKHEVLTLNQSDAPAYWRNVLVLSNVQISDTYTCVAESDIGTIEQDVKVLIAGI